MSAIDYILLAIILGSAILSYQRGFVKVSLSVATIVMAIAATLLFTTRVANSLPTDIFQTTSSRYIWGAIFLFFGTGFIGGVISWLFRQAVGASNLGPVDRFLGVVFGIARGMLFILLLVLLSNLTPSLKQENWWRESALLPRFQSGASALHAQLPMELAVHFDLARPVGRETQWIGNP